MEKQNREGEEVDTSQFFLVRLWPANSDGDSRSGDGEESQVQGKVQHVLSGEAGSFNDWPTLMRLLKSMMRYDARQQSRTRTHKSP
ncbi:MAG TPA: hypothetical protein VF914_06470 [Chloroflexia bacterium]|jgi:hypothetical protein